MNNNLNFTKFSLLLLRQSILVLAIILTVAKLQQFSKTQYLKISNNSVEAYTDSRIIDDQVFDNYSSMTESQIQNLLLNNNSCLAKMNVADYQYSQGSWQYVGSILVSRLIFRVSNEWKINPQVVLSTLQKEQSLLTLASCPQWKLDSAMGYACPDSAACSPRYANITKQILWGSWQLKFNKERSYGNVNWNDDGNISYVGYMTEGYRKRCQSCTSYYYDGYATIDGQLLKFANEATASLYTYTPHLGQSFPRIFETYFGTTYVDGQQTSPLVKTSDNNTIYIESNNILYPFPTWDNYIAWGMPNKPIRYVSKEYVNSKTQASPLRRLIRFDNQPNVYIADYGQLYTIQNPDQLYSWGFTFNDVQNLPSSLKFAFTAESPLGTVIGHREDNHALYTMEGGKKRWITDPRTYATLGSPVYSQQQLSRIATSLLNLIPEGQYIMADGTYVKNANSNEIYIYNNGKLHWFDYPTWIAFGGKINAIVNTTALTTSIDINVPRLVKTETGDHYIVVSGTAYKVNQASLAQYDLSKFTAFKQKNLSQLNQANVGTLFKDSNGIGYIMRGGKLKTILTWNEMLSYGEDWQSSPVIDSDIINKLK